MSRQIIRDLRGYIEILKKESELLEIDVQVDPCLEIAEIHRRVIARGGPALLFTKVKGSSFRVATNLFGTARRLELAFGHSAQKFVADMARAAEIMLPPSLGKLWAMRDLILKVAKIGTRIVKNAPILDVCQSPSKLTGIPMLTSWKTDGGAFVTLPLVYTEHPAGKGHNLGMYRVQRYDDTTTGIHWQIHKGGGYHYHEAELRNESLPLTLFIGGPPALIMAAIAPLPENVPELLLASLLLGEKLPLVRDPLGGHLLAATAEFAAKGVVPPHIRRLEGPFGDHYGYNSLAHDYPVFQVERVYHRRDAIYPATVVGRPRQEDFYIGEFLQDLLSPLFPLVMNGVRQLKTYGEAGFHCLAAARVMDRYPREAFASGLRILGEGQLSLTKFLIVTDGDIDVADFRKLWIHVLERVDWQRDLFIFANVSQDTLDYTGPSVNKGSKAMLMGLGRDPIRALPEKFTYAQLPVGCSQPKVFLPGTLVIQGESYSTHAGLADQLAGCPALGEWPLAVIVDNSGDATLSLQEFLWTVFTRFEPAADIYSNRVSVKRFHVGLEPPIILDCRMKPWYTPVLEADIETKNRVDARIKDMLPPKWR